MDVPHVVDLRRQYGNRGEADPNEKGIGTSEKEERVPGKSEQAEC